jgi:hypothetical protein
MIPTDEAHFIQLWQQGLPQAAMAQALGCPVGTVKSRLHALLQQGKIQRRRARPSPPVQRPVQPVDTGPVQRLDQLEDEVQGLRLLLQSVIDRLDHLPGQTPVQITTLPPYPKGKAVRWNLWILDAIRDDLAALAAERGVSPSQLVQELLWKALTDRRSSTP